MIEISKKYADILRSEIYSADSQLDIDLITIVNHSKNHNSRSRIILQNPKTEFKYLETTKDNKYFTDYNIEEVKSVVFDKLL